MMLNSHRTVSDVLAIAAVRVRGLQPLGAPDARITSLCTALLDAAEDLDHPRPDRRIDPVQIARRVLQIYQFALHLAATGPVEARPGLEAVTAQLAVTHVDLDLLVVVHSTSSHGGIA